MAHPVPFFLHTEGGRLFCIHHEPKDITRIRGAMVYVHPFAEEMNKARRMAAVQARALADAGWSVLTIDLAGCGDSEGDFGQADWPQWRADVALACEWLRGKTGRIPALWGLRAGCLLACEVASSMEAAPDLLFWQPTISGKQFLQQFLRLRVTGQLFGSTAQDRTGTKQLHEELRQGNSLEVAGYTLSSGLAMGLDASELTPPATRARVVWLEVVPDDPAGLSPAAHSRIELWKSAGHDVAAATVTGPAFWQTQEITECPALVAATLAQVNAWQG